LRCLNELDSAIEAALSDSLFCFAFSMRRRILSFNYTYIHIDTMSLYSN
jgi:hypothetical protein